MPQIKQMIEEHAVLWEWAQNLALPPEDMMAAVIAAQAVLDQIVSLTRELGAETELLKVEAKAHSNRPDDNNP